MDENVNYFHKLLDLLRESVPNVFKKGDMTHLE